MWRGIRSGRRACRTSEPLHVGWADLEWPDARQFEIELEGRSVSSTSVGACISTRAKASVRNATARKRDFEGQLPEADLARDGFDTVAIYGLVRVRG